jgi:hypothetical protein
LEADISPSVPSSLAGLQNNSGTTVTVGDGDTVAQLAAMHYGKVDADILQAVRKANPSINNIEQPGDIFYGFNWNQVERSPGRQGGKYFLEGDIKADSSKL